MCNNYTSANNIFTQESLTDTVKKTKENQQIDLTASQKSPH